MGVTVRYGGMERPVAAQPVSAETVGRVTVGAIAIALSGDESGLVALGFDAVMAVQAATGERRVIQGGAPWAVAPLSRDEAGGDAVQHLMLRSSTCYAEGGATLDLAGGAGCRSVEEDTGAASGAFRDLAAGQGVEVRLVFQGPDPILVLLLIDETGVVTVVRP